jgi:hypothetical protein
MRRLTGIVLSPVGSQYRRPARLHCKSGAAVTLDLNLRPRPRRAVAIEKHHAVLGNGLPSINAAVPSLTGQSQQPEVVLLELIEFDNRRKPPPRRRFQVLGSYHLPSISICKIRKMVVVSPNLTADFERIFAISC